MSITAEQVLPPDVVIAPVASLEPRLRRRFGAHAGDVAVSRPGGRIAARLVDSQGAALLALFRRPRRIVDAVAHYARARRLDPARVLTDAFPMLRDCCNAGFLLPASDPEARRILPLLRRGRRVGRWTVMECLQALSDSEVYRVRGPSGPAALKIVRPPVRRHVVRSLVNEARTLARLAGAGVPALLEDGARAERPFLVLSWCTGVTPERSADDWRATGARQPLLELCARIAEAYASLHARGCLHGDVRPGNLLVSSAGEVTVLDFGYACAADHHGGVRGILRPEPDCFAEPELARAALAGRRLPPVTAAGEQYALAALLYLLLTGETYLDFAARRREALRQIARDPPLSFAPRRTEPWPAVERLLRRALSKSPGKRFASVADLARELRAVSASEGWRAPVACADGARTPSSQLLRRMTRSLDIAGRAFTRPLPPPTAGVSEGAAGVAFGLYRIARIRRDPRWLAWSDAWLSRAERAAAEPDAFWDPAVVSPREAMRVVTPYHTASGVHLVRAFVSHATGDLDGADAAARAFVEASGRAGPTLDLTMGRAGSLLCCALLLAALRDVAVPSATSLRALGQRLVRGIWTRLARFGPVPSCRELPSLGVAHGWAGILYATLRWCRAAGVPLPSEVPRRIDELAQCAEPSGRGVRWPIRRRDRRVLSETPLRSSWCNGSAGLVHLWTLADRVFGSAPYAELAALSGWDAWDGEETETSLCCGLAGRAYALLALYRQTGDPGWLRRARLLADRAARDALGAPLELSLYRGGVGIAVLAAELAHPEEAAMPLFEDEGWPRSPTT